MATPTLQRAGALKYTTELQRAVMAQARRLVRQLEASQATPAPGGWAREIRLVLTSDHVDGTVLFAGRREPIGQPGGDTE